MSRFNEYRNMKLQDPEFKREYSRILSSSGNMMLWNLNSISFRR